MSEAVTKLIVYLFFVLGIRCKKCSKFEKVTWGQKFCVLFWNQLWHTSQTKRSGKCLKILKLQFFFVKNWKHPTRLRIKQEKRFKTNLQPRSKLLTVKYNSITSFCNPCCRISYFHLIPAVFILWEVTWTYPLWCREPRTRAVAGESAPSCPW